MKIYSYLRKISNAYAQKKKQKYLESLIEHGLQIGKNVYMAGDYFFDPSHCFLISIGDNCIFAPNVKLIAHDASTKILLGYTKIGKIEIKENCFIGESAIVLPNVKIGPNSIVGSGSVVTKDVPPNTIVAGNPAKIITTVEKYKSKVEEMSQQKKIFGEDYFIDKLDEAKREEIIQSINDSIGFIV